MFFLPPANEVWGKSVSHSVHRGGVCLGGRGVCLQGESASRGGVLTDTDSPRDTTGYGQRACGTHPTGMHSCLCMLLI